MSISITTPEIAEMGSTLFLALIIWYAYKDHISDYDSKYSTFWPRFWSPTIDEVVLWPIVTLLPLLVVKLVDKDPYTSEMIFGVASLAYFGYSIYCHGLQGATVGKRMCKVRVVDAATEKPISYKQAFIRDLIPLTLIVALLIAGSVSNETGDKDLLTTVALVFGIWFLLEILTMLTNAKRRALHDFIAGNVVVRADIWEHERLRHKQAKPERIVE